MKTLVIALCLLLCGMMQAWAQPSDSIQITVVVDDFIKGLRSRDSTAIRSLLAADAEFQVVSVTKGRPELVFLGVDSLLFYAAEGKRMNPQAVFHTDKLTVKLTDAIHATASMEYHTLLAGEIYRLGVIHYELLKVDGRWEITFVTHSQIKNNHQGH